MGPKAALVLSGVLAVLVLVLIGAGGEQEVNAIPVRRLEEKPTREGVAMAATLLGSISFIMCLYYFVNYEDPDIQQKSWEVISSTISIFCAVLLWQSFNDMMETYIIDFFFGEGETTDGALAVDILHMLAWFSLMQLSLGWLSRATGLWQVGEEEMEELEKDPELMEEEKDKVEISMACFAVLLAHITGFSSINAFGTVQQKYFSESPLMAFIAVPVAFCGMLILQRITAHIREKIMMSDDGKKDEFEEMWDDETKEAENDVMGLTLSFTMINAVRFMLTGCLPNQEGQEEVCPKSTGFEEHFLFYHTTGQKWSLIGAGFFFTAVLIVVRKNYPESLEEAEIEKKYKEDKQELVEQKGLTPQQAHQQLHPHTHNMKILGRLCEGATVAISMCFSWSVFYGFQMILAGHPVFEGQPQLLSVVLALTVSIPLMFGLIPLDWLADQDWTDDAWDNAIRGMMDAMALTIGFAWEQCFDACVDAIAVTQGKSGIVNIHSTKLGLSIFCAALLVPAWKWYILPFMVKQGWKYGYVLGPSSLADITQKMQDDLEKELNETVEGESKKTEEEKQKLRNDQIEKLKKVEEVLTKRLKELQAGALSKAERGIPADATSYSALPGDNVEALTEKNRQLSSELQKAKQASLQCQQMLDKTMENMFASLKQMNVTVTKIEESNRR